MAIWATRPVEDVPLIQLAQWAIMELPDGDRHFIGWNLEGEGRASSRIETFDPETMKGITRSGRVYKLIGPPSFNKDAQYVWANWCAINRVNEFKNVSSEYWKEPTCPSRPNN